MGVDRRQIGLRHVTHAPLFQRGKVVCIGSTCDVSGLFGRVCSSPHCRRGKRIRAAVTRHERTWAGNSNWSFLRPR